MKDEYLPGTPDTSSILPPDMRCIDCDLISERSSSERWAAFRFRIVALRQQVAVMNTIKLAPLIADQICQVKRLGVVVTFELASVIGDSAFESSVPATAIKNIYKETIMMMM